MFSNLEDGPDTTNQEECTLSPSCAGAHPVTHEKVMLPLGGDHRYRYRYRGRNRYRLFQASKTDCDCDCDPDTDPDVLGFLLLFSKQKQSLSRIVEL